MSCDMSRHAMHCSVVQRGAVMRCYAILQYVVQCYAMLCCILRCYAMLYNAMLCCDSALYYVPPRAVPGCDMPC
eukprot:1939082-Pyramimonas_sp.AAC.1